MQLNELSRPNTREEAETILLKGGYERIAGGTYAVVYGKPGANTVLKLIHKRDVAYMAFVNLAVKHQDNPHFPRFSGKLIRLNDDYRAVRMERLVAGLGAEDQYRSFIAYALDLYIARKGNFNSMRTEYAEVLRNAFLKDGQLQDACDLIVENLWQYVNDLHPANVMFRGDTVVITDPVAPHTWQQDMATKKVAESVVEEDFHRRTTAHKPLAAVTVEDCAKAMFDADDLRDVLTDGYLWQECYSHDYDEDLDPPPVPANSGAATPDMIARLSRVLAAEGRFNVMKEEIIHLADHPSIKIIRRLNRLSDISQPLGVHWSLGHQIGADTEHYGPHLVYGEVASSNVDWITTVTRGLMWWHAEEEITPVAGAPITLLRIEFGPGTKGVA